MSYSFQPHGLKPTRLLGSSVKNTGVGSHSLLQGIFLTQGSNLGLLHCRQILYCLSHQGSQLQIITGLLVPISHDPSHLFISDGVLQLFVQSLLGGWVEESPTLLDVKMCRFWYLGHRWCYFVALLWCLQMFSFCWWKFYKSLTLQRLVTNKILLLFFFLPWSSEKVLPCWCAVSV